MKIKTKFRYDRIVLVLSIFLNIMFLICFIKKNVEAIPSSLEITKSESKNIQESLESVLEVSEVQEKTELSKPSIINLGQFKITAYCPCKKCCEKWAGGPTATGIMPTEGITIAVDPKIIPYGSTILINEKEYIAQDCGGAIKNNRIDVYFNEHQSALDFGVQYHDVFLKVKEE